MTYQAVTTHNNAGNLADLNPQPASDGIQTPEYAYSGNRHKYGRGDEFIILKWDNKITVEQGDAILTALGIDTAQDSTVTVRVPDDLRNFANYNGTAYRPDNLRHDYGFYTNFQVLIAGLEAL